MQLRGPSTESRRKVSSERASGLFAPSSACGRACEVEQEGMGLGTRGKGDLGPCRAVTTPEL